MRSFFAKLKVVVAAVAIISGISLLAILAMPTTTFIGDGAFDLTVHSKSASGSKLVDVQCYVYPTFAEAKVAEAQALVEREPWQGVVLKDETLELSIPLTSRWTKHPFWPSTTRDNYPKGLLVAGKLKSGRRVRAVVEVVYREGENSIEIAIP